MMKPVLFLLVCLAIACSEPRKVTFNPDDHAATSGTVGSSKATTTLPRATPDTAGRKDTTVRRRDLP